MARHSCDLPLRPANLPTTCKPCPSIPARDTLIYVMHNMLVTIAAGKRQAEGRAEAVSGARGAGFAPRDFLAALAAPRKTPHIIAECKPRSPSGGSLLPASFSPENYARAVTAGGASAVSVLTDAQHFGGSFELLTRLRGATSLPVLAKDFFVGKAGLRRAAAAGADAALLIAAILNPDELLELARECGRLGMTPVCEVASVADINKLAALKSMASQVVVGVNVRDLEDFSLRRGVALWLGARIPDCFGARAVFSGFGVGGAAALRIFAPRFGAALVGSSICAAADPRAACAALCHPPKMLKVCGARTVTDANLAMDAGAAMIGINRVPRSRRRICGGRSARACAAVRRSASGALSVAVFENADPQTVANDAQRMSSDLVQLSGAERARDFADVASAMPFPIIKTLRAGTDGPAHIEDWAGLAAAFLVDASLPGAGETADANATKALLKAIPKGMPTMLAGGVRAENAAALLRQFPHIDGLDMATGAELTVGAGRGGQHWSAESIGRVAAALSS